MGVQIKANEAEARENEGKGEAAYVELTGRAEATKVQAIGLAEAKATEALGLARAIGFEAQTKALGSGATAVVAVANAVSEGHITVVPEVLVTGGGGALDGLAATLMRYLSNGGGGNASGSGNGGSGSSGGSGAAIDAPKGPETVPEPVPEPPSGLDEPPMKE